MIAKVMILLAAILLAAPFTANKSSSPAPGLFRASAASPACPSVGPARAWAKRQRGVSFALLCQGKIEGYGKRNRSYSASTGKALLLVAFLRRGRGVKSAKGTLKSMIRYSDNSAASAIYSQLGDRPLAKLTRRLEMNQTRLCGCWSSIIWSPADYTRLLFSLPRSVPIAHRRFAMRNLRRIVSYQRWGIPQGVGRGWRVYFKGGWRPEEGGWIVLQGALLRREGQRMAFAVFTSKNSSLEEGAAKIKKATRLVF